MQWRTTLADAPGDNTAQAVGDGSYLDGMEYLRGINVYTLEQQRDNAPILRVLERSHLDQQHIVTTAIGGRAGGPAAAPRRAGRPPGGCGRT